MSLAARSTNTGRARWLLAASMMMLVGCAATDTSTNAPPAASPSASAATASDPSPSGSVRLPPTTGEFDCQLSGSYPLPAGVTVVSRDRADRPAKGAYSICYVNGFQTQPEQKRFWRDEHPGLLLRDADRQPVVDGDWDEWLLDTRTEANREAIAGLVGQWIEGCARSGFDALEIDNLDSYARSQGLLSRADNVAMMARFSAIAHAHGLASAQKNSTELLPRARELGTDFAIAEECNQYAECADYTAVYGDRVYVIEYRDRPFAAGCRDHPGLMIVRRDRQLTLPGDDDYVNRRC
ncbi:endo alpha-1,4 polygalactosaminidase [Micropruina sp.]|uniref:endo alpha-1,4 polygalactosaminidase n=1 Tax=Micropruina sp. TaxID=2737536 RepID=UPI0039E68AA6